MKPAYLSVLLLLGMLGTLSPVGDSSSAMARTVDSTRCPRIVGSYVQLKVEEHPPLKVTQTGCSIKGISKDKDFEKISGRWLNGAFLVTIDRRQAKSRCVTSMVGSIYKIQGNEKLLIDIYGTDGKCGVSPIYTELSLWSKL
ncbi:MAG: hypothetical protein WCD18_00535 [Thermosynechococcaceae cyanobacterium]